MATQIRRDLLSSFGLNSGDPQSDPYTQAFLKNSLDSVQPQLENSLIGRGLGGSSVYQGALSDLFSKLGTQATLNSQQYKLNNLNPINDYINNQNTIGQNLIGLANNRDITNNATALDLYKKQYDALMYNANRPDQSNNAGLFGSLGGGALALGLAPFTGGASLALAPILSGVGGNVGGMFDPAKGGSGVISPDLSSLMSLFSPQGSSLNIPGYGPTSTNGFNFSALPSGGGYSNIANVFGR